MRVDPARIKETGMRERTSEEWIGMAEEVFKAGTLQLLLTGGEAMLRPDFTEIYEAIARMGFLLVVYTNATLVTPEIMEVFRRYPPHKIGVTLYGAENATYERLCGMKDGFDRAKEGIERLHSLPSLLDLRTTLVQDNIEDLQKLRAYAKGILEDDAELHISRFVCKAVRNGVCHPEEVRLTPEENVRLNYPGVFAFHEKMEKGEVRLDLENLKKITFRHSLPKEGYLFSHCGAGVNEYAIDWAGRMMACELLSDGFTYPFEEGFEKAWERLPEVYPKSRVPEKCRDCPDAAFCDTCPANRLAETGDWFGCPDYACREAAYFHQLLKDMKIV